MGAYQNVLGKAQDVANTPYQAYGGPLVAGINGQQNTAIGHINDAYGSANPYINSASNYAGLGAAAINPTAFSADAVGQYMSPYQNSVINSTLATINNQNAQQQQGVIGDAIKQGAWGGDRAGIAQAELAGQQDLAKNQTIAGLENQNYAQALGQFNNQQQIGLGAAQNNAARYGQAAYTMGSLGQEAQNTALTGAGAQLQAGGLQQGTQQAMDTANYGQFMNKQAYPFQTLGWLAGIDSGIGSQMGGTSTSTQTPPSSLNSIIGGGLSLASMFMNRGGVVEPKGYAAGGGIGEIPYSGVSGYVPQINLGLGHTMPTGGDGSGQQQTPGAGQSMLDRGLSSLGSSVKSAGGLGALGERFGLTSLAGTDDNASAFTGMPDLPMGDDIPMPFGRPDGLARGGFVDGGGLTRAAFDQGGDVGPSDLVYDPDAMNLKPTDLVARPGLDAARVQPVNAEAGIAPSVPAVPVNAGERSAVAKTMGFEGGLNPRDTNGTPTNFGINQGANPDVDVNKLTPDQARKIYHDRYWKPIGADAMDPDLQKVAFDTSVMAGPGKARDLVAQSGGDPQKLMDLREQFLNGLVAQNPDKYGPYATAWANRNASLRSSLGMPSTSAMVAASPGLSAAGGPLAYDEMSKGLAPAQGAISSATSGLGNASQDRETGLFGLPKLSDNARMGLLAAGLGMMSSRSPWVGVAAGEGGMQGIQTYFAGQKNSREQANTASEIATRSGHLSLENRKQDLATGQLLRQLNGSREIAGLPPVGLQDLTGGSLSPGSSGSPAVPSIVAPSLANRGSGQAPAGGSGSPVSSAQPGAASSSAPASSGSAVPPSNSNFWNGVAPSDNPYWLERAENTARAYGDTAAAQKYHDDRQNIMKSRQVIRGGQLVNLPGAPQAQGEMAAAEATAKAQVEQGFKPGVTPSGATYVGSAGPTPGGIGAAPASDDKAPSRIQVEPGTAKITTAIPPAPMGGGYPVPAMPNGARMTGIGKDAENLASTDAEFSKDILAHAPAVDTGIERYRSLAQAFKLFESGSPAERQYGAAALAAALGQKGMAERVMGGDPAAVEWVNKEGVNLVLDTLRAATPRFAQSEFNKLSESGVPSITNRPEANQQLVAEGLGQLLRNKSFMSDWEAARRNGWSSISSFYTNWSQANPLSEFISSAQKQVGNFKGASLPKSSEWTEGAIYSVPKKINPDQARVLGKYGVQPGQMFKFNGRNSDSPIVPIRPQDAFKSYLPAGQ